MDMYDVDDGSKVDHRVDDRVRTTEDLQYLNAYLDVLRDFVFVSDNIHIQNHSRRIVVDKL